MQVQIRTLQQLGASHCKLRTRGTLNQTLVVQQTQWGQILTQATSQLPTCRCQTERTDWSKEGDEESQ